MATCSSSATRRVGGFGTRTKKVREFRFLATRRGRPPLEGAPRHDLAIVRERARLVRLIDAPLPRD